MKSEYISIYIGIDFSNTYLKIIRLLKNFQFKLELIYFIHNDNKFKKKFCCVPQKNMLI